MQILIMRDKNMEVITYVSKSPDSVTMLIESTLFLVALNSYYS